MMNSSGMEPHIEAIYFHNREIIYKILKEKKPSTVKELNRQLENAKNPFAIRLLYAGVLACLDDSKGQAFLLKRGRENIGFEETKDIFWIIGHLEWFLPCDDNTPRANLNMKWAEDFMLEMLSVPKSFNLSDHSPPSYDRRSIAMSWDINFGNILCEMKSPKLYSVLEKLWNEEPGWIDTRTILSCFETLEDKRAIPLLIKALKDRKGDEYRYASYALAKMKVQEAIPILLENLDDSHTYSALSSYQDDRILPALEKALPSLKKYALGEAKMLIIELKGEDKLPQLIALAKDPNHKSFNNPMDAIQELKDKRAIPFAVDQLTSSPDLYSKSRAIQILETFPSSNLAIKALIDAFDIDFQALAEGKQVVIDNNEYYRKTISESLKKMTGQSLGVDKKKWLNYYQSTFNARE